MAWKKSSSGRHRSSEPGKPHKCPPHRFQDHKVQEAIVDGRQVAYHFQRCIHCDKDNLWIEDLGSNGKRK